MLDVKSAQMLRLAGTKVSWPGEGVMRSESSAVVPNNCRGRDERQQASADGNSEHPLPKNARIRGFARLEQKAKQYETNGRGRCRGCAHESNVPTYAPAPPMGKATGDAGVIRSQQSHEKEREDELRKHIR